MAACVISRKVYAITGVFIRESDSSLNKYTSLHDRNSFELMESNRNKHHLGVREISEEIDNHKPSIQVTVQTSSNAYMIDNILGNTDAHVVSKEDDGKSLNFTNTGNIHKQLIC